MAEYFLVKRDCGGIAYIGGYTGLQEWGMNLVVYFFEELASLGFSTTLGDIWKGAIQRYIDLIFPTIESNWGGWTASAAYHHIQKMMLFGDPSLFIRLVHADSVVHNIYDCRTIFCLIPYKILYRGCPIRFLNHENRFVIDVNKINQEFNYSQPLTKLPRELDIYLTTSSTEIGVAIYDNTGQLIIKDISQNKQKTLHLRPEQNQRYWLVLFPLKEQKLGELVDINLRTGSNVKNKY
jgi:hypothetical protein